MCGIVAAVSERNVVPILLEGLHRLEYRGYDSAGLAVIDTTQGSGATPSPAVLVRRRASGKVARLDAAVAETPVSGKIGVAHTRWATHGVPNESNAHPHVAGQRIAIVHNGIIENHGALRESLRAAGRIAESDTDSELIAMLLLRLCEESGLDLQQAVGTLREHLRGAYAVVALDLHQPDRLVATRHGSPLIVGVGIGEHFLASDSHALAPVTPRYALLADDDVAVIEHDRWQVWRQGVPVKLEVRESHDTDGVVDQGAYRHFMEKEIHEQPRVLGETLEGRLNADGVLPNLLGPDTARLLRDVRAVQFVACGTSFHAASVARGWIESELRIPAAAEVASEYRYRDPVVRPGTLLVVISQSGETADTLSVLRDAKARGYVARIAVCNRAESAMVRESDAALMTRAGVEIGVASTKAFTTQLLALALLALTLDRHVEGRPALSVERSRSIASSLFALPGAAQAAIDAAVEPARQLAGELHPYSHALFLGRGLYFPIAQEGALKLKEISYIHAEAYPSGELKHGPLALIDESLPVIAVAPTDRLLEKLLSNLHEVRARGGRLFVVADHANPMALGPADRVLQIPSIADPFVAPILMTIPLQLIAYHTAVLRGTDVDRPRNLAKAVTVE